MIILRSQREIEKIRKACLIVAEILESLKEHVQPGITTWDLNVLSEELALKRKAKPAFKGYHGYPFSLVHLRERGSGPRDAIERATAQ